jgi:hypothetical protein
VYPDWGFPMTLTNIAMSLIVNALVTGLIIFRIFKVFREVKAPLDKGNVGATSGRKLRSLMFVLIESGIVLFSIQFARLVVTIVQTYIGLIADNIIISIHQIFNVIIGSIIAASYFIDDIGLDRV